MINNKFENLGNSEVESWDANSVVWVYKSTQNVIRHNYFNNIYGDGVFLNGQSAQDNLVSKNTFNLVLLPMLAILTTYSIAFFH